MQDYNLVDFLNYKNSQEYDHNFLKYRPVLILALLKYKK